MQEALPKMDTLNEQKITYVLIVLRVGRVNDPCPRGSVSPGSKERSLCSLISS